MEEKKKIKINIFIVIAICIILITVIFVCINKKNRNEYNEDYFDEEYMYDEYENDSIDIYNENDRIPLYPLVKKPIIYLYPTTNTNVTVKVLKDKNITCSYPKYNNEWKVYAKTNGELTDLNTNRQLYSLYYESNCDFEYRVEDDGFVIKGEDSIKFLEEKLEILGLNEKEAEEFIVYWLPTLESSKYNYIRFASIEEIDKNMPIDVFPKPDTKIRVIMTFKPLDKYIKVDEQKLNKVSRSGFTFVEWGGVEIK